MALDRYPNPALRVRRRGRSPPDGYELQRRRSGGHGVTDREQARGRGPLDVSDSAAEGVDVRAGEHDGRHDAGVHRDVRSARRSRRGAQDDHARRGRPQSRAPSRHDPRDRRQRPGASGFRRHARRAVDRLPARLRPAQRDEAHDLDRTGHSFRGRFPHDDGGLDPLRLHLFGARGHRYPVRIRRRLPTRNRLRRHVQQCPRREGVPVEAGDDHARGRRVDRRGRRHAHHRRRDQARHALRRAPPRNAARRVRPDVGDRDRRGVRRRRSDTGADALRRAAHDDRPLGDAALRVSYFRGARDTQSRRLCHGSVALGRLPEPHGTLGRNTVAGGVAQAVDHDNCSRRRRARPDRVDDRSERRSSCSYRPSHRGGLADAAVPPGQRPLLAEPPDDHVGAGHGDRRRRALDQRPAAHVGHEPERRVAACRCARATRWRRQLGRDRCRWPGPAPHRQSPVSHRDQGSRRRPAARRLGIRVERGDGGRLGDRLRLRRPWDLPPRRNGARQRLVPPRTHVATFDGRAPCRRSDRALVRARRVRARNRQG